VFSSCIEIGFSKLANALPKTCHLPVCSVSGMVGNLDR
jgi:hypothetical protein